MIWGKHTIPTLKTPDKQRVIRVLPGDPDRRTIRAMRIESSGHSRGNPRMFELVEHAPKTGRSPTVWAWPELMDYLKIAGQPVQGPWPPHQEPRPDPEADSMPIAVAEPEDDDKS